MPMPRQASFNGVRRASEMPHFSRSQSSVTAVSHQREQDRDHHSVPTNVKPLPHVCSAPKPPDTGFSLPFSESSFVVFRISCTVLSNGR
jgi:hypothetical protein